MSRRRSGQQGILAGRNICKNDQQNGRGSPSQKNFLTTVRDPLLGPIDTPYGIPRESERSRSFERISGVAYINIP